MIKRIKVSDFKSIGELELTFDSVTVLVGRSGTGKSNLVQAVRFLRNVLVSLDGAVNYEGGWQRIFPVGKEKPRTSIEAVFSVPGEERDYNYLIAFATQHGQGVLNIERLLIGQDLIFSRVFSNDRGWTWEKAPELGVMPNFSSGPMLGSFPSLGKVVFAYAALATGIGYYHFPSSTLDPTKQPHLNPQEQQFSNAIPGLADNAANYREIMRRITQDFHNPNIRKSLLASLKAVNPSIVSLELDSVTNPNRAIVGHSAAGRVFELGLEQESDGLRRFYAHLLALYQTPPKLTLVFEEPENAIFPGALSLLADEFIAAPRGNRGQVILTTHSPVLLDSFDVDCIRVVEMQDGKTVVGAVSKEQRDAVRDQLLTTGELLTVEQPRTDSKQTTPQPA